MAGNSEDPELDQAIEGAGPIEGLKKPVGRQASPPSFRREMAAQGMSEGLLGSPSHAPLPKHQPLDYETAVNLSDGPCHNPLFDTPEAQPPRSFAGSINDAGIDLASEWQGRKDLRLEGCPEGTTVHGEGTDATFIFPPQAPPSEEV